MLLHRRRHPRLLIAGALAVTGACNDHRTPTEPPTSANAAITAAAGGNNSKVKVRQLQLSSNTLRIDGPGATASVSIGNSGVAIQTGISVRAAIVQGAVTRNVANVPTQCLPGDAAGFLPNGNCDMTVAFAVSNAGGGSPLVPGAAEFVLTVVQAAGGAATELATKAIVVNLVGTPSITSVSLTSLTLAIGGPSTGYTAVLQNPANSLQGVLLQGTIVQGATRRAAGGASVMCGGGVGVFPTGTCTFNFSASASNTLAGVGTLTPGAAVFELKLIAVGGGTSTTYDTKTVAITLISSTPKITSLVLSSTSIVIGGASVDYTVKVQNPGFPASIVVLQGEMVQETAAGTAIRGAGGFSVTCGAAVGTLPTTGLGTCTMNLTTLASNTAGGVGTLVPGPARFVLHLYLTVGENTTELDTKTVDVTLVSSTPTITAINPASTFIVLGASFTSHTTTISNPGLSRTGILIQGYISQPSGARRAAGGTFINCSGSPFGTLPAGGCTTPGDIVAGNSPASGSGTLVPGPATYEMELKQFDGTTETILDTKSIPITLVAPTPSIVSVALVTTSIPIGGEAAYTATLYNPTGSTLTGVSVQGWMDQAPSTARGAGGVSPSCGAIGELPPGVCLVAFRAIATNGGAGVGTLVPGAATFRLELRQNPAVLDTKSTAVTLTSP